MTMQNPWGSQDPKHTEKKPSKGRGGIYIIAGVVALILGLMLLNIAYPEALSGEDGWLRLTYGLALIAFVGGALVVHIRLRPVTALKQAAIWVIIILILVLGYSYGNDGRERLVAELSPDRGHQSEGQISYRADMTGHFFIRANINNIPVRFMVDTGASEIVLSPADARRVGFDLQKLTYSQRYQTANGIVAGAPVRLNQLVVGPIVMTDIRASVNSAQMRTSLLGMHFLNQLSGYQVRDEVLTLYP
ncbi:MAG: TIGR02281 family clan AA aspartic protease [Kordiimonas sp.]|nr:TIGR02281 family clan AA aspartic protease [Kordiimonas sp.]